jgi:hypothetical protein
MLLSVSWLQTDSITQHIAYFQVTWETNQIWNKNELKINKYSFFKEMEHNTDNRG